MTTLGKEADSGLNSITDWASVGGQKNVDSEETRSYNLVCPSILFIEE